MLDKAVLEKSFGSAAEALVRLGEAVAMPPAANPLAVDATIQRFEFTFELMWKLFRKIHLSRAISVRRPTESIREAGAAGWLKNRLLWEQMLDDRTITSHTYDAKDALMVYERICKEYYPELQRAYACVKSQFIDHHPFENWNDRDA